MFRDDCSTALVAACVLIDGFESTDPVEEEEGARERDRKQKKNEWKNRNGRRRRRRRRRRERQKKEKKKGETEDEEEEERERDNKVFTWKLLHANVMCHSIRSESDRIGLVHDVC